MIGVFDSGIGGLTVVRALMKMSPGVVLTYLGDTARAPYGTKSPETVRRYSAEAVRFLLDRGAEAVVIACNTASSLASDHLRAEFPGLPIFEVVTPAVAAALAATKTGRIGVIGTRATIGSGVYESRLKAGRPDAAVTSVAAPLLVSLVEEGWLEAPETASIVGKYLEPVRLAGCDTLILACTHYPVIKPLIAAAAGPSVALIDSAEAVAARFCDTIVSDVKLRGAAEKGGPSRYFVTDPTPAFAALAAEWLGRAVEIEKTSL